MRPAYVIEPVALSTGPPLVCLYVIAPRLSVPHADAAAANIAAFLVEKDEAQQRVLERLDVGIAIRSSLR